MDAMKGQGIRFTTTTFNIFLDACSKYGETSRANEAMQQIRQTRGIYPPPLPSHDLAFSLESDKEKVSPILGGVASESQPVLLAVLGLNVMLSGQLSFEGGFGKPSLIHC